MGYDRDDSFPFNFYNQIEILFGSKSKGKLSPRSYPIQCEGKWKYSFLSVPESPASRHHGAQLRIPLNLQGTLLL